MSIRLWYILNSEYTYTYTHYHSVLARVGLRKKTDLLKPTNPYADYAFIVFLIVFLLGCLAGWLFGQLASTGYTL